MKYFEKFVAIFALLLMGAIFTGFFGAECNDPDPEIYGPSFPEIGETIYTDAVYLGWSVGHDDEESVKCYVHFGTDPDELPRIGETEFLSTICHWGSCPGRYWVYDLEPATTYYWYIYGVDGSSSFADFASSDIWYFETADEFWPDGTPYYPKPDSGDEFIAIDTQLTWYVVNYSDMVINYDVFLGTISTPLLVSHRQSERSYNPPVDLEIGETYYWRVNSYNSLDQLLAIGPVWKFTTAVAPGMPYDPSPDSGATDVNINTYIRWQAYGIFRGDYHVYFGDTIDPPFVANVGEIAYYDPGPLNYDTKYYWKIIHNADNNGIFEGPLWHFTTANEYTEDIYGKFILLSGNSGIDADKIVARFDTAVAPDTAIEPLQAAEVTCNAYTLWWDDFYKYHVYDEYPDYYFLQNGVNYEFTVTADSDVPGLAQGITFPECSPNITSPNSFDHVSKSGFGVSWSNYCGGVAYFTIITYDTLGLTDSSDIWIETDDDGSYNFTSSDLTPLGDFVGKIDLVLIKQNIENIDATGFKPESVIMARRYYASYSVYLDE